MSLIIYEIVFPEKSKLLLVILLLVGFITYTGFIYKDLPVTTSHATSAAMEGKALWQQKNCNACHQVYGLGGYLGPDLTNVFSKRGPAYISAFLKNGTPVMPNFHFTQTEINALLAYLKNIDHSGTADPRKFTKHYDGTIE